ncbi:protein SRC2 homolog [Bidens hawaiensis]|uniref:protein SRC2 homolog n=1 Tax=Bidens hawaiensis TaxID=980011 RepID=UPI0040498A97
MAERSFKLKLISANGLNKLTRVGKMDVYAVAYISGGTMNQDQKQRTFVDRGGDSNPIWNCQMKFTIDEYAALKNRSVLVVKIIMEATLGDKTMGQVHVPIKGLLEGYSPRGKSFQFVSYQVKKPSGKLKGELSFSYKFGASKLGKPVAKPDKADELVTPCNHVGTYNKLQEPATGYRSTSLYPSVYEASVDAAPEFYQPPAPTAAAPGFYQPPALPTFAAPGFYQPPAPTATAPGYFPLAGGANYTPMGYPQPQAGYTYQQQSCYGGYPPNQSIYSGYSQLPPMYGWHPLQQSGYDGYFQPPMWYPLK